MSMFSAKAQTIVRADPAAVFNAFADGQTMSKFWFDRTDDRLMADARVNWYVGKGEDAFAINVFVKHLLEPEIIVIEWGVDGQTTQVTWDLQRTESGDTHLTITEEGFSGTQEEIVAQALDSTAGFNQVIIALKALLEHGASINVVEDHAS